MPWIHEFSVTVPAPVAQVFAAFATSDSLEAWFAERAAVELMPEGPYRFWGRFTLGTPTAEAADQRLLGVISEQELVVRWDIAGCDTEFQLTFVAVAGGTVLRLRHRVDGDLNVPRQREMLDDFWRLSFGNLAAHLSGGGGLVRPDLRDRSPEIRLTIDIAAPPERVFRTLVEPELVRRWAGGSPVIDPRAGGAVDFGWRYQVDDQPVRGGPTRIIEFAPPTKVVFDWPDWRGDRSVEGQYIVFELEPIATGTRLYFRHAGFSRATDLSDYPFGWNHFLKEIAKHACIV